MTDGWLKDATHGTFVVGDDVTCSPCCPGGPGGPAGHLQSLDGR